MKKIKKKWVIAAAASVFALGNAQAQTDFIVNGGFEAATKKKTTSGGLYGWTKGGPGAVQVFSTYDNLGGPPVTPYPAVSGNNYFVVMSATSGSADTTLTQMPVIPPAFNQPLTLSFDYNLIGEDTATTKKQQAAEQQGSTLSLFAGGIDMFSQELTTPLAEGQSLSSGWQKVTINLTPAEFAEIQADGISFDVNQANSPHFDFAAAIDNVSLSATVPESPSTGLLLGGILSVGCFLKRRMV